ncbi:histidine phosphatase family protein [Rathayibacter sp. YIM 133350]|uniref:histidine phosphatase family protein n=1 Tax=Rathayibacter sp. YIM 133350 TaxID=3131992 RepID=UPI003FD12149
MDASHPPNRAPHRPPQREGPLVRRVALVRHGETDWNARGVIQGSTDIELNESGRVQAAAAARSLRDFGATVVVSSPLSRACETAAVIAAGLGIDAAGTDHRLTERNYGAAEGVAVTDAHRRWPHHDYPGAEPFDRVAARGSAAVEDLAEAYERPVAVAHGTLIRVTVEALTGEPVPRLDNGAIVLLEDDGSGWRSRLADEPVTVDAVDAVV